MYDSELIEVRPALEAFAGEVFEGLPRSDQRATGLRYLRGLMLDGRRKSMQPMAQRLGVDHQQLQQFVTSSTWDGLRAPRGTRHDVRIGHSILHDHDHRTAACHAATDNTE